MTLLPADDAPVSGFDTGPGNALMDAWTRKHRQQPFDRNGAWADSGTISPDLLGRLMENAYFRQPPPKSTGRELFNLDWLECVLDDGFNDLPAGDVQATLCELTARSVTAALELFSAPVDEVYVCGGGIHNALLMQRLQALLKADPVTTTEDLGLHPDWVEATAFAWLARQTLEGRPGNLPTVTGARHYVMLGAIYPGRN